MGGVQSNENERIVEVMKEIRYLGKPGINFESRKTGETGKKGLYGIC